VWQSPDPILGEYMSGQTNGGVFNPKNLSLFTYTYNNPVNLVDPDGNAVFVLALPEAAVLIESGIAAAGVYLAGMLGIETIKNSGGMVGGGFQVSDDYGMDHSTTIPSYEGDLGSFSEFPSAENDINIGGFEGEQQTGDISVFPASKDNGPKVYNADYTENPKQKVNSAQVGDLVRTPTSHKNDFTKKRGGLFENTYTKEQWSKSNTQHSGGQEWKVGLGKKAPSKSQKITVSADQGKILKVDK